MPENDIKTNRNMWKFIKELPTETRKQRVIQAALLLIVIFLTLWGLRDVPALLHDTDWRVNKPHFDEGRIENGRYIHDPTGWEIAIPDGWELGYTRSAAQNRRAVGDMTEYGMTDSLIGTVRELVTFRKGKFDSFSASVEPAGETSEAGVTEEMGTLPYIIEEQFSQMGMRCTFDDRPRREVIDGKVFYSVEMEIEVPDRQMKLWMISYGGLVGDSYMSATISHTSPQNKLELLEAWRGSVFRER